MTNFKPSKKKALITATAEQLFEESRAVIEPLSKAWPVGAGALNFLLASAGLRIKYKQEILNQFTDFMMSNPRVFSQQVVDTREFQDGLVVFINSYFKLRTDSKLELARRIFYDFGKSTNKPEYPLERYDDTLEKISESGIRFLGFINTEVPKLKDRYVDAKMRQNGNQHDKDHYYQIYTANKSLSSFIEDHISSIAEKYAKEQDSDRPLDVENKKKEELRQELWLGFSELEQLGLARSYTEGGLGWSATPTSAYGLTHYGKMFISVIKPDIQ